MIEWLLGLDELGLGEEGVRVVFARGLPDWGWFMVVLAAVALGVWSYRRLEGSLLARVALGAVRAAVLIVLAVLIAGPELEKTSERLERDWVVVLVDRSASLGVEDVGEDVSREMQLRAALAGASRDGVWRALEDERNVLWLGFDGGAYELGVRRDAASGEPVFALGEPDGRRTAIGRSIDEALARTAGRRVSGVVVMSDGRSVDGLSRAAMKRLSGEQIPVIGVALGSAEAGADLAVVRVEHPRVAFGEDFVPVQATVSRVGGDEGGGGATVQLIDDETGIVLSEERVRWEAGQSEEQTVTLTTKPGQMEAGERSWSVRVRGDSGEDLVSSNDARAVRIEVVDEPMRVVVLDGYPRWEYRYLAALLEREESVRASGLLLSSRRRYLQEGNVALAALPTSPEEWRGFNVVVLGDVRPEVFTRQQLEQLRDHVAVNGGGLVWVGGEGATPWAWADTPMADLLPMRLGTSGGSASGEGDGVVQRWEMDVVMEPTQAARRLGVLRLWDGEDGSGDEGGWLSALSRPDAGWSRLRYAQRIEARALKPTVQVLATARGVSSQGETSPIVTVMQYGAGRVVYVGTDEIWRWRYGRGEVLTERFWLQLLRMVGREALVRSSKLVELTASPGRAEVLEPVRIGVELLDQSLVDAGPDRLRVRVRRVGGVDDMGGGQIDAEGEGVEFSLVREEQAAGAGSAAGGGGYGGGWVPTMSGRYVVETTDPLLAGAQQRVEVEVWRGDDELRRSQTDHEMLRQISEATGGTVLEAGEIGRLVEGGLLPNRSVRVVGRAAVEPLWDSPLALILVVVLLTVEWVWRRVIRLA